MKNLVRQGFSLLGLRLQYQNTKSKDQTPSPTRPAVYIRPTHTSETLY